MEVGVCLLEHDVPFGHASSSHQQGLSCWIHNQHLTGNITPATLKLLLGLVRRFESDIFCDCDPTPQKVIQIISAIEIRIENSSSMKQILKKAL
jgi:hypothetical protein